MKNITDPDVNPFLYRKANPDLARPSREGLIYALRNLSEVCPNSSGIIAPATSAPWAWPTISGILSVIPPTCRKR
jgi:hypothetical protein